ncbi:MAG: hypothetical protein GXP49_12130 [Deltaproteobacteria bacterium]|nr:hypothetical protein [Deltaproteobacteria bacterium]
MSSNSNREDFRNRDTRRLKLALFASILLLFAAMGLTMYRQAEPDWKQKQEEFISTVDPAGSENIQILQVHACDGNVDRCTTCHLGIERKDISEKKLLNPFKPHPGGLLTYHPATRFGCSSCHGGNGRALTVEGAHKGPAGGKDPLLREPHIQASCGRCHVPGDAPGMEVLVKGARLYLGLGCTGCHPLGTQGKGSWDFGPDLTKIGRKSPEYLVTSILDPTANFADSSMPSFKLALGHDRKSMESLVVFLESLALAEPSACTKRTKAKIIVDMPCASCHAGPDSKASGVFSHKCPFIIEHKHELSCGSCHPSGPPAPSLTGKGRCPVVEKRRASCSVCH